MSAKRILADGNVIGNHSYSHDANHALTFNSYKDIAVAPNRLFMTLPGLNRIYTVLLTERKVPGKLRRSKDEGYIEVLWNISTNELSGKSPEFLADQIVKKAEPGGIILLHDGYGTMHNLVRAE